MTHRLYLCYEYTLVVLIQSHDFYLLFYWLLFAINRYLVNLIKFQWNLEPIELDNFTGLYHKCGNVLIFMHNNQNILLASYCSHFYFAGLIFKESQTRKYTAAIRLFIKLFIKVPYFYAGLMYCEQKPSRLETIFNFKLLGAIKFRQLNFNFHLI